MSQNSFPDNVPSAKQGTAASLAAPGRVGAGGTNDAAWRSIADFLTLQNLRQVLKASECAVAAGVAGVAPAASAAQGAFHSVPVGNHGEIVAMGVGV